MLVLILCAGIGDGLVAMAQDGGTGTALVQRAPTLNGTVEGSIQQLFAESTTLNGGARVSGDLLVPGMPEVRLNGRPDYEGTIDGPGSVTPTHHRITLNGGAQLRHVVRRTDPTALPVVAPPPAPTGVRSVSLNGPGQLAGDFSTLRHLTLNGNAGRIAVPPGAYGNFTANGSGGFVLGIAGSTAPAEYAFQRLTLNGASTLEVVGPVVVTLANGLATNATLGLAGHPEWLNLRFAAGGLTLNGGARTHARVEVPAGAVTLNGNAQLIGGVAAYRLTVNGGAVLRLVAAMLPTGPADTDGDGMPDDWELAHGLDPNIDERDFDPDGDGLTNHEEYLLGLHPNNPDTDGDGLYDGDEIHLGLNPKAPNPDTQPPSAPAGLTAASAGSDRITLTWQPAADNLGVAGYIVYRDGQPIETADPIRTTTFTDQDLPAGEEFTYQVRSFDFAGNLSTDGPEVDIATLPEDSDADGLPDEWVRKYFAEEDDPLPEDDPDGDGLSNAQEYVAGSDPLDFYNAVKPVLDSLHDGGPGPQDELAMIVRRPDGTPWPGAPVTFTVRQGQRRIAAVPGGPDYVYQLTVRADASGLAQVYLEPLAP
ncbi:MAG: hypothetical protein KIT44_04055 [Opitutaceae bacterium]|nr:hypothetical protein [Opitutaceae bacterium]